MGPSTQHQFRNPRASLASKSAIQTVRYREMVLTSSGED